MMKFFILLVAMSTIMFGQSRRSSRTQQTYKEGNVIIKLEENLSIKNIKNPKIFLKNKELLNLHNTLKVSNYKHIINQYFLVEYDNRSYHVEDVLKLYNNSNLIEYTQPNYIGRSRQTKKVYNELIPNDEYYGYQWYLHNDGSYTLLDGDAEWDYNNATPKAGADIKIQKAWAIEKGDPNLIIAIVDGGVYLDHPEFEGRIWKNTKEIPNNGKDDDNNGYIDDVNGWDFVSNDNNPTDESGHGTACAGIAAASINNGIGYAGINGGSKIMAVRVDGGNYTSAGLVLGLKYAADNGAKVINLSLGQYTEGNIVKEGVTYAYNKGAIMVAATANDGTRIGGEETSCEGNESRHDFPGCFPEVIAVGGTTYNDARMVWLNPNDPNAKKEGSAYGNHIDVVAPGYSILTVGHKADALYPNSGQYGCSFATPQVTGVISLILSINPKLTFEEVRDIIRKSADDQVGRTDEDKPGRDMYMGYGRLNAYKALLETQKTLGNDDIINDDDETTVFPNPFTNTLSINSPKNIKELTIYSAIGAQVFHSKGTNKLELPKLSSGIYLLKITLEDGGHIVKKLIHK